MRRSTVLTLPLQLVFPASTLRQGNLQWPDLIIQVWDTYDRWQNGLAWAGIRLKPALHWHHCHSHAHSYAHHHGWQGDGFHDNTTALKRPQTVIKTLRIYVLRCISDAIVSLLQTLFFFATYCGNTKTRAFSPGKFLGKSSIWE